MPEIEFGATLIVPSAFPCRAWERGRWWCYQIDELLTSLQRTMVYHDDLRSNNIPLVEGQPMLIDLDVMTSYKNRSKFRNANRKDINRFAKNWVELPEAAVVFRPIIDELNSGWNPIFNI